MSADDYAALRRVNCSVHNFTFARRRRRSRMNVDPYAIDATPVCEWMCDSHRLDVPLELYPEIAEVLHHPRNVAPYAERFQYFPRLVDRADPHTGDDEETWPLGYLERMAATEWNLTELLDAELGRGRSTVVLTDVARRLGGARLAPARGRAHGGPQSSPRAARTSSPATRRATPGACCGQEIRTRPT